MSGRQEIIREWGREEEEEELIELYDTIWRDDKEHELVLRHEYYKHNNRRVGKYRLVQKGNVFYSSNAMTIE